MAARAAFGCRQDPGSSPGSPVPAIEMRRRGGTVRGMRTSVRAHADRIRRGQSCGAASSARLAVRAENARRKSAAGRAGAVQRYAREGDDRCISTDHFDRDAVQARGRGSGAEAARRARWSSTRRSDRGQLQEPVPHRGRSSGRALRARGQGTTWRGAAHRADPATQHQRACPMTIGCENLRIVVRTAQATLDTHCAPATERDRVLNCERCGAGFAPRVDGPAPLLGRLAAGAGAPRARQDRGARTVRGRRSDEQLMADDRCEHAWSGGRTASTGLCPT